MRVLIFSASKRDFFASSKVCLLEFIGYVQERKRRSFLKIPFLINLKLALGSPTELNGLVLIEIKTTTKTTTGSGSSEFFFVL